MTEESEWERRISRRLRLRDLHLVFTVAGSGSMAQAATRLNMTQSAVSQMIADLEKELGVRLFDRGRRGVQSTTYAEILIRRGKAAFDELRQGVQEIEWLANSKGGEIRIGCPETLSASILPDVIDAFSQSYPGVTLQVDTVTGGAAGGRLRDRSIDLVFARGGPGLAALQRADDMHVTKLFEDRLRIVVGARSAWAERRRVDLGHLIDAPWVVLPYGWGDEVIPEAFRERGLPMPRVLLRTFSIHLRLHLASTGRFATALPLSVLDRHRSGFALKELPIELPRRPYEVAVVTLKDRTLSPAADQFIETALSLCSKVRDVATS